MHPQWVRSHLKGSFIILMLLLSIVIDTGRAQPITAATDYEWEINTPGRTIFRDRTPIGQIALIKLEGGGIFGGKGKPTGEMLTMIADVSFVPGDTLRFFGAAIEFGTAKYINATIVLDPDELPSFWKSANYISKTATNIANTERIDTSIRYRGKSGWSLEFTQQGQDQFLGLAWTDPLSGNREHRSLTPDQLSILADLIDLTIFELNRQGASITLEKVR
ncbi:hypothetical protein KKH18_05400 [bacterium]|nr:hypothetical protein [bacterium]